MTPVPSAAVAEPRGRLATRIRTILSGLVGFVVLAMLFEILSRLEFVNPLLFPPPSVVLPRAAQLVVDPAFLQEVGATLLATLLGIAIAFVIAVPVGLIVGSYRLVASGLTPIIDFLRSIPGLAVLPLLVLTLGQGLNMKVAIVVFVTVWPLLYNTIYGVRGVDRLALETAHAFHIRTLKTWLGIVLPSAMPLILTGLRIAISIGLAVEIAAELSVGTQDGVGYFILKASHSGGNFDIVFAAVILAGVLGLLLNWATIFLTRRVVAWETRGGA